MEALASHTGSGIALRRSNVDTDQVVPSEFCKRITKTGFADALFARWRDEEDFVLNDPLRADASILLAGENFGTGSSREHAVWALRDWGFAAVIASSFGDIFYSNALKNGLLTIRLADSVVAELMDHVDDDPAFEITVDLQDREVRTATDAWPFVINERARWLILNGYDDIEVTLQGSAAITAYEGTRRKWLPVVRSCEAVTSP
jgi:3-isopropylmalate/(R)-2-methylmalate dehydratase small subunit